MQPGGGCFGVRVITGEARGRRLQSVPGKHTRPTSDRVKEAVFSVIQFDIEGRRVLDLFAGTGQLGIEALSRGAEHAVFLDNDPGALLVIRDNLRHTGLSGRATVIAGHASATALGACGPFDIIFMDPPHRSPLLDSSIEAVASADLLRRGGVMLCECARDERHPDPPPPYSLARVYNYGATSVRLYRRMP